MCDGRGAWPAARAWDSRVSSGLIAFGFWAPMSVEALPSSQFMFNLVYTTDSMIVGGALQPLLKVKAVLRSGAPLQRNGYARSCKLWGRYAATRRETGVVWPRRLLDSCSGALATSYRTSAHGCESFLSSVAGSCSTYPARWAVCRHFILSVGTIWSPPMAWKGP